MKNSDAPAVKREAEEDFGVVPREPRGKHGLGPKHGAKHLPEEGAPELPGFFLGQAESSPALRLVFEDTKTAEECANAMKRILDKAVGMRAHV
jgi:hypothetical protein